MIQLFAFYMFATIVILAAVMVILARNPVHSVLWLILAFFNAAGLMVLVGAEFVAVLLVIVYVGAVAVLFLFVVMMLDIDVASMRAGFVRNAPLGFAVALVLLAEMVLGFGAYRAGGLALGTPAAPSQALPGLSNIQNVGALLYTRYVFLFEMAGLILLVAMIGAIVLTHRDRRGSAARQDIARQIGRKPVDATVMTRPKVGEGVEL
ncbi:NADH-quinone oxidoreductase subunit J [Erythrobacteraceae bacterium CFH 75059]|uniref:NADH-quinone oxidoreductase subunit J n=1 Tax=Qipengyuania thermophila TaxID=2509361 RepID=UPI00101FC4DC|nr:NADH-quinone oxidoreductase subunit J [Qipengyuania thermophila]TCD05294.1 NADH-quinone oxidoreductase subunit J [Erythrobacteraceae bacterium CFH 75059]